VSALVVVLVWVQVRQQRVAQVELPLVLGRPQVRLEEPAQVGTATRFAPALLRVRHR